MTEILSRDSMFTFYSFARHFCSWTPKNCHKCVIYLLANSKILYWSQIFGRGSFGVPAVVSKQGSRFKISILWFTEKFYSGYENYINTDANLDLQIIRQQGYSKKKMIRAIWPLRFCNNFFRFLSKYRFAAMSMVSSTTQ